MKVVGVDLGGTEIKIGLVDKENGIEKKISLPTEVSKGTEKVVQNISEGISSISKGVKIDGIGIGSPGSIDRDEGVVRFAPNFPEWKNFELSKAIGTIVNLPVFVENDANSFALGEWYFGHATGLTDFVCITLGTGIGGGVVSHGILITGKDGIGTELGHVIIEPDGPLCGCGNRGCAESIASASSVARTARELIKRFPESLVLKTAGGIENIQSKHVFAAAQQGDYMAQMIVEKAVDVLARLIGGCIHIFNPEKIIIGGGMSKAGDALILPLRKRVEAYIMVSFRNTYTIHASELVENAGILGAASSAIYALRGD